MRRALQITVLLMLVLILHLTLSQPSLSLMHLTRLQQHLITLYEQYCQNASAVDLERFMDVSLMRRTQDVIDMIRGWALDAREEELNVHASMNYMRSVVLYASVTYANSLHDAFSALYLDAEVVLRASQIFRIRTTYKWQLLPCDEILRFELMQFQRLALRARAANDLPYVKVYSTNTASARFFHEISTCSSNASFDFTPLPRNPQSNVLTEVNMLAQAQNLVLAWNTLRCHDLRDKLYMQLFYMNENLRCMMHETLYDFMHQYNITTRIQRNTRILKQLVNRVVLQRYIQFVLAEFGRHAHHPAHLKYAYVIGVNATTSLNVNHARLINANEQLNIFFDNTIVNSEIHATFHSIISDYLPLRVTYVRYNEYLTLRVDLACQHEFEQCNIAEASVQLESDA